jgi:hypothetical protein
MEAHVNHQVLAPQDADVNYHEGETSTRHTLGLVLLEAAAVPKEPAPFDEWAGL